MVRCIGKFTPEATTDNRSPTTDWRHSRLTIHDSRFAYLRGMTDASVTAEKLLQAGAVKLSPENPFTWASGWKSPIYCDNRKVLSHPFIRDFIKSELCNVVFEQFAEAELVAGVATAGIAWGAMIADQLKLPFIYVRPKPKEHGLGNQIEGEYGAGQKTIVIEDLISTGKSSLQVVEVLRQSGLEVTGMVSIFNYRFEAARLAFEAAGLPVYSLTDYPTLLENARKNGTIGEVEQELLLKWRSDPANWTGLV
jgi:orotate phosphoribosyltransferase